MSRLTVYVCPRHCAEAIDWYAAVLGAVEDGQRYVDPDGRVGHAEISIGDATLMLSDAYPDYGAVAPAPGGMTTTFALQLRVSDADATVARAAAAGAVVQRPVDEQLAGYRMGTLMDPFGIRWMLATRLRDVSQEDLRAEASDFSRSGAPTGPVPLHGGPPGRAGSTPASGGGSERAAGAPARSGPLPSQEHGHVRPEHVPRPYPSTGPRARARVGDDGGPTRR